MNDVNNKIKETNYEPEIIISVTSMLLNSIVIGIVVFGVVTLYGMSGSWHSLWLLLALCFIKSAHFTRD